MARVPALLMSLLATSSFAIAGCPDATPAPDAGEADAGVDVDAGPLSASQYCETLVDFFCPYYLRCGRINAADLDTCRATFAASCEARYEPSYVALENAGLLSLSRDGMAQCAAHLADVPCVNQIFDLDGPCSTVFAGLQPAGSPCGFDVESFVCAPGTTCVLGLDFCGTCRTVIADGDPCTDAQAQDAACGRASVCEGGRCHARPQVGEPCVEGGTPCVLGAGCQAGTCVGPSVVAVGAACDSAHRCPYASACVGGSCVASGALGAACSTNAPCDSSGFCAAGTCTPLQEDGSSCASSGQCQTGRCIDAVCGGIPSVCLVDGT